MMMSMTKKAGCRRRSAAVTALLLMTTWGVHARGQEVPADPDFEAALRSAKPSGGPAEDDFEKGVARSVPAASAASRIGTRGPSGDRMKIAPAGALPSHWRGRKGIDAAAWRQAEDEARHGLLDPHAFAEMVFGRLPVPPGATPVRCRNSLGRIWFTLGKDVPSAEYAQLLAQHERNGGTLVIGQRSFLMEHSRLAEKATAPMRAQVGRYYASINWQRLPDRNFRDVYVPSGNPARSLRVGIYPDAYVEQLICNSYAPGLKLPTGPIMELLLPAPPN
ncbi:hypothetical protein [Sphingomonas sp. OTU376]|uniref:hypothetical protein n=1 Tax=Sphingomonas sp. OTU376 TaxID=3043863 RepID=UPI00313A9590